MMMPPPRPRRFDVAEKGVFWYHNDAPLAQLVRADPS
jgi:hypothetical protein